MKRENLNVKVGSTTARKLRRVARTFDRSLDSLADLALAELVDSPAICAKICALPPKRLGRKVAA